VDIEIESLERACQECGTELRKLIIARGATKKYKQASHKRHKKHKKD